MNEESKKPESWGKKIAIAIIHGAGEEDPDFSEGLKAAIQKEFIKLVDVKDCLEFKPIYWARILQDPEDRLLEKMQDDINCSNLSKLYCLSKILWRVRKFIVSNFADAVAYQPSPKDASTVYDTVHAEVARTLSRLADAAGGNAPLCVIGHSLGTVIASNYFYDISHEKLMSPKVKKLIGDSFLEQGKTLVLFYTLGCPIALWSVRFPDFGKPISVPAKEVANFKPSVEGEWVNFYEKHDPFSLPLSPLPSYAGKVRDCKVKIGNCICHMSPTCHNHYFENKKIAVCIAEGLARTWCSINEKDFIPPERKCSFFSKKCDHSIAKSIRMSR